MNISIAILILSVLINYILVKVLNLGFDGVIISKCIIDITNCTSLYIYSKIKGYPKIYDTPFTK